MATTRKSGYDSRGKYHTDIAKYNKAVKKAKAANSEFETYNRQLEKKYGSKYKFTDLPKVQAAKLNRLHKKAMYATLDTFKY